VIGTATNTVGTTVPVGNGPTGIAVTPDGAAVYVGNVMDNTVSVIATATNTVAATVPVGQFPLALGQFIQTITSVPFTAFSPRVTIAASAGSFEVNSPFTLGAGSPGIHPLTDAVTLQLGAFTITIPGGSFVQGPAGKFMFEGVINGVSLEAIITPKDGGGFAFRAEGAGASGLPTTNPVTVSLTIGINTGTMAATAEFK
jgi:YVTN family beta-propeller protein